MKLTEKEAKTIVLGLLFTAIILGTKLLGAGELPTGYIVYSTAQKTWAFDNPDDYTYDLQKITIANRTATLKLQTETMQLTENINAQIGYDTIDKAGITNLSPTDYQTALLKEDGKYYKSGSDKIKTIPTELKGMLWIKTDENDKNKEINVSLEADRTITVFIGYDKRSPAPYWLSQWTYWGDGINTSVTKGTPFKLYYRQFEKGEITLGSNNNSKKMYIILINATVYNASRTITSETHSHNGTLTKIEWNAETPQGTSVKIRIKESPTESGLERAQWSSYYTESSSTSGQSDGSYIKYEALLETTDNTKTSQLKSATLTFEKQQYPETAEIETNDITAQATNWENIITTEELNGQNISYEYSTDSGSIWNPAGNNEFTAVSTQSGKIRIKAKLASNRTHTPKLSLIEVNYTYISCTEKWETKYTPCTAGDARTKYYTDANNCGTNDGLPQDNGTTESCNYCTPAWERINLSCLLNDTKAINYQYINSCCSDTQLASDCTIPNNTIATCDYCIPIWKCAQYGACQHDGAKKCLAATDANNCQEQTKLDSDSYRGNYSEFTQPCSYDSQQPVITSITASKNSIEKGQTITITATINDESNITAKAILLNENRKKAAEETMKKENNTYTTTINTSQLEKGIYRMGIEANDANGNTATEKEVKLLAITDGQALVKRINISELRKKLNKTDPATNKTIVELEMSSKSQAEGEIAINTYKNHTGNATKPSADFGKYVDIVAEDTISQNITNTTLRIYYTDQEITSAGIKENSIKIYYYNETALQWQPINTTVNHEENYVEATITHYSTYGIFGESEQQQQITQTEWLGGSGGGGGSSITKTQIANTQEDSESQATKEPEKKQTSQPEKQIAEQQCNYDIKVSLPGKLALQEGRQIKGTITNTGNCEVEVLKLNLLGDANKVISIEPEKISSLKKAETKQFSISRAKKEQTPLQGRLISQPGRQSYNATLQIKGTTGNLLAIEQQLKINIKLEEKKLPTFNAAAAIMILAIAITILTFKKRKNSNQNH